MPKPRLADVRVVRGEIDANKLLSEPARRARGAGAEALTAVGARVVTDGEQLGSFVEVPAKDCALVIARGGRTVSDIDLFVYSDGGDRIASDEAPDPRAAVMICPPHPRRVYVVARSVSGEGMIALGVMRVATENAEAVSAAMNVRGGPGQDTGRLARWPGLERAIRERRASLASHWEDVRRIAVPLNPRAYSSVTVPVRAQRCVDILIVPGDEVASIDAKVVDDTGLTIARAAPPGKNRAFLICADTPQTITVMVRPRVTSGLAAVVIGQSQRGAAAELSERSWVAGAEPLHRLNVAISRHVVRLAGLRPLVFASVGPGDARVGAPTSVQLDLRAGCTRVDVVGGTPLGRFVAALWSHDDRRPARVRGGETANLFPCGAKRRARVEVSAMDRAGPFSVQTRHDTAPPTVLAQHPVAAARLLMRLEAVAGPLHAQYGAGAKVVHVAQAIRVTERLSLGAGKCANVAVALGDGASDVVLSTKVGNGSATRSLGQLVTLQQVCAGPSSKFVELSIGVGVGEADALLLVHSLP